ncbi:MAG: ABC transporter substrate-binding protein [Candidatus Bathyarchaeia archaeon]
MDKRTLALLMVIAMVLPMLVTPAYTWTPPGGGENGKFELYGPHVRDIRITLWADEEAEWREMDAGKIDITDWPLTPEWIKAWEDDPRFTLVDYGGEYGYFILDLNNNGTVKHYDGVVRANPLVATVPYPHSGLYLRRAIAYAVSRRYIIETVCEGLALPMWTPVPPAFGYAHPDIKPGGALEQFTYGGLDGNPTEGLRLLEEAGFKIGPDGWRYWDKNNNSIKEDGEELELIFYARSDSLQRKKFAEEQLYPILRDVYKIPIDWKPRPRGVCSDEVFGAKRYHLYTGGWILAGPETDYLYDLYHVENYWHPGKPPNYNNINDSELNNYAEICKFAPDEITAVEEGAKPFQVRFAVQCFSVPLWCASGVKAFKNKPGVWPKGGSPPAYPDWTGMVNEQGFGINSWYSTLNMRPQGIEYFDAEPIRYGFKTLSVDWLNPVYAEWYWDNEVIGRIYDVLGARNPYAKVFRVPQLAYKWETGTWKDPADGQTKTKVTVHLRPDIYWMDGKPITIYDVWFTFIELVDILESKGLIVPWWYPTVAYMKSVYIIDPYTIEILMDVFSCWATGWVLGTVVIPAHIWKPLALQSTIEDNKIHTKHPDPDMIGSGPYRLVEYVENSYILMTANTKGSTVTTNLPGAKPITSPGYWAYEPVDVVVDVPSRAVIVKPGDTVNVDVAVKIINLLQTGPLTVKKYVYLDGDLKSGPTTLNLENGTSDEETFTFSLGKGLHKVKAAVHITYPSTWACHWVNVTRLIYVTCKEDSVGSTFHDDVGWGTYPYKTMLPTPDFKVDLKDVFGAAVAFGSYPGHKKWNSVFDLNSDFKVDLKDYFAIARKFGW